MKNDEVRVDSPPPSTFKLHPCPFELKEPGLPARVAFDQRDGPFSVVQSDQPLRYVRWSS